MTDTLSISPCPDTGSPHSVQHSRRVAVLVPTRNEARNVRPLLDRLIPVLRAFEGSVLFVDDSTDDTAAVIRAAALDAPIPVRVLHRKTGERAGGLGGAVQAGLRVVEADWVVVMDGDLQHPPETVGALLETAIANEVDMVVASRYSGSGSAAGLANGFRARVSSGATLAAKVMFPRALAGVSDPMSGFFAVRAAALDVEALVPRGFKILLEVLARTPGLRVAEVSFTFAERVEGDSKASAREALRYLRQLAALRLATPAALGRLMRFAAVGASGMLVNLLALALLMKARLTVGADANAIDAVVATQVAVAWNFALTERWVYRGAGRGWGRRLLLFWALSCGALLVQLPLAGLLAWVLGSYLVATGTAIGLLMLARFEICDRLLFRWRLRGGVVRTDQPRAARRWRAVGQAAARGLGRRTAPVVETP